MDEYERLKQQKDDILKRQESAKDKEIQALKDEVERLKREKDARVYYQNIVYAVCIVLDQIKHKKPGDGIVCGTLESPSTEVQDGMKDLQSSLDAAQEELARAKKYADMPSSREKELTKALELAQEEMKNQRIAYTQQQDSYTRQWADRERELVEGLRKAQYIWLPKHDVMQCVGCCNTAPCKSDEKHYPPCKPDCWLSALIEGKDANVLGNRTKS
jgi:hypothetical protein